MTTDALYAWLLNATVASSTEYGAPDVIKVGLYLNEFENRVYRDHSGKLLTQEKVLIKKYGPCWGRPEAYCRE